MVMQLMAGKVDQTASEGTGGGYYAWSDSTTPLLCQFKLGAGKLLLRPRGFALPHYADSSKFGYVTQGTSLH
ncbi:putative rmlC-like cupin domain superfamily, rmlC-like jelly roll protein [Helianthus anomalus]